MTPADPRRPARWHADPDGLLSPGAALAAGVALLLPVILFAAGAGSWNRGLYPATALAAAIYLYAKRSPWFLGLCLWLFCATPLIRRLTDLQAGWDPANPLQLAPYLACLVAAASFLPYALRDRPRFVTPFVVMLACVAYGFSLAAFDGRILSGAVDVLRWSVGPLLAVYLLRHADLQPQFHRVLVDGLLVAGAAMAVYAVAQFVAPAAWDREWMINVAELGLNSIGQPRPFEVRVFGTMNAPASFAGMLTLAIIVGIGQRTAVALPLLLLMSLALALTQYRAGWGGLMVGLIVLALTGSATHKLRIALMAVALLLATGLLASAPEINRTLGARFDTLTRLASDRSAEERLREYGRFFTEADNLVLGDGLAIAGATRRLDGRHGAVVDAGLTEPFQAFGVFGGTVFLTAVAAGFLAMWSASGAGSGPFLHLYRAAAAANLAQLPFGRVLIGESGFGMWLCIGLALASIAAWQRASRPEPGSEVPFGGQGIRWS
ncbi:hypothetical protein SH611_15390 [Geminicoccaceae bacterium 1502E]|nr:hypothetical protein [Geminicoccaceae bacterium 1502E]